MVEWIYGLSALASALAAALAWAAKLWWGKEHQKAQEKLVEAKDAQIASLHQQVDNLRELTPMRIREYFESVKLQLEEYIEHLKEQLKGAHNRVEELECLIQEAQQQGSQDSLKMASLKKEKENLQMNLSNLERQVKELASKSEQRVTVSIPSAFDAKTLATIQHTSGSLSTLMGIADSANPSMEKFDWLVPSAAGQAKVSLQQLLDELKGKTWVDQQSKEDTEK